MADNERPVVRSITEARSYVDVSTGDGELAEIVADVGPKRRAQIIDAAHDVAADIRIDMQRLGAAVIDDENSGELEVLQLLPPQTFRQEQAWRQQLLDAVLRLCDDTERWGAPVPRCTGEEMALHLILQRAQAFSAASDWSDLFEILFQDHDVLMLYDMPGEATEGIAGAVNLAPATWFDEFALPFDVPDRP